MFIYKEELKTILKNITYIYDLTNYSNFVEKFKSNNECEIIEKGKGAMIIYTIINTTDIGTLKNVQEANGAICTTQKNY